MFYEEHTECFQASTATGKFASASSSSSSCQSQSQGLSLHEDPEVHEDLDDDLLVAQVESACAAALTSMCNGSNITEDHNASMLSPSKSFSDVTDFSTPGMVGGKRKEWGNLSSSVGGGGGVGAGGGAGGGHIVKRVFNTFGNGSKRVVLPPAGPTTKGSYAASIGRLSEVLAAPKTTK
jgi:hypothetical protein